MGSVSFCPVDTAAFFPLSPPSEGTFGAAGACGAAGAPQKSLFIRLMPFSVMERITSSCCKIILSF